MNAFSQHLVLPLILTALPLAGFAQESAAPEPFGETVDVKVINVEVHVTDKDGLPVADLTADEFEIVEDGRPVPISNFYRVNADVAGPVESTSQAGSLLESTGPASVSPVAGPLRPEDQKLRVVVFIDNFNTRPSERNRNMPALRQFLQGTLRPDDEAMVVSYDRALHVHEPFTTDHPLVYEALFELEKTATFQGESDSARRDVLERVDEANSADEALLWVRSYADSVLNDLEHSIEALNTVVSDLAGLTGRKILVHVSSGVPMIAGGDMFYAVEEKFDQGPGVNLAMSYDQSRRFAQLASQANAHGVTFYTIDVAGLRTSRGMSASEQGLDTPMMGVRVESDRVANRQSPLRFMARETGGRAIVNQNNVLPPLQEVSASLRAYYSLGFVSAHGGDNQYHELRVKVARKNVTVDHRRGYRDQSVDVEMENGIRAALIHRAQTNPWGVTIRSGAAQPRDNELFVVPIQIVVPLSELELIPGAEYVRADLTFSFGALDDSARLSPITSAPVGVRIPTENAAAAAGESYIFNHQLLMRRGGHTIGVGIRDHFGAESVFVTHQIQVP